MLAKKYRLTKRGSFSYVYRKGERKQTDALKLIYVQTRGEEKVGFSVSNKIGKAVVRNKVKRRLRAAYRQFCGRVKPAQMVFMASESIVKLSYQSIVSDVRGLLRRAGLLIDEKNI